MAERDAREILIPAALVGVTLGGIYLASRTERRAAAEDDGGAELARAFLPNATVTPTDMRGAARELRAAGADANLASALEEMAALRDAEFASLPAQGQAVTCRLWSTCQFFAEPSVYSAYVDGLSEASSLLAVERTVTGWTRVTAPLPSRLVLDVNAPLGLSGWIRTDELAVASMSSLTLAPAGSSAFIALVTAKRDDDAHRFMRGMRDFGAWVESPAGMATITVAANAAATIIPGLGAVVPIFFAVIRIMNATLDIIAVAERSLQTVLEILDGSLSIDKIYKVPIFYQVANLTTAYRALPELVERVGLRLPADPAARRLEGGKIGETLANINLYTASAFAGPVEFITRPGASVYKDYADRALVIAREQNVDLDLALARAGLSPATHKPVTISTVGGREVVISAREDAVALAMNSRLDRKLYSPDWYDAATGSFVADREQLRRFIEWEYARATHATDASERSLHLQRLAILQRADSVTTGSGPRAIRRLGRIKRHSATDPSPSADQMLAAWQNAKQTGRSEKIVNALFKSYEAALTREADDAREQQATNAAYAERRSQPDPARGVLPPPPTPFGSQLLTAGALTAPAWFPLLVLPAWRRSTARRGPESRRADLIAFGLGAAVLGAVALAARRPRPMEKPTNAPPLIGSGSTTPLFPTARCRTECYAYPSAEPIPRTTSALYASPGGTTFDFEAIDDHGYSRVRERGGAKRTIYILTPALEIDPVDRLPPMPSP